MAMSPRLLAEAVAHLPEEPTPAHLRAMVQRADLLEHAAAYKRQHGITWLACLALMGPPTNGYGTTGGSAGDRRLIAECMAILERQVER